MGPDKISGKQEGVGGELAGCSQSRPCPDMFVEAVGKLCWLGHQKGLGREYLSAGIKCSPNRWKKGLTKKKCWQSVKSLLLLCIKELLGQFSAVFSTFCSQLYLQIFVCLSYFPTFSIILRGNVWDNRVWMGSWRCRELLCPFASVLYPPSWKRTSIIKDRWQLYLLLQIAG